MILDDLTLEQFRVSTGATSANADKFFPYLKDTLKAFEINTTLRLAAFFSQVGHESGGLASLEENLNYSAEGLANTWPNRYAKTLQNGSYAKNPVGRYLPSNLALEIARKPVLIASRTYADRMGNGSVESQDGWKYKGRGLLQTTGKANYAELTLNTGIDFVSKPDLLKEPFYALISACVFWRNNKLNELADKQDITTLTKRINGGTNGLIHRKELYSKAIEVLTK